MTKDELRLLFEDWIAAQSLSDSSVQSYIRDIAIFFREYFPEDFENFLDKNISESFINAPETSLSTRKRRFVSLRKLYAFSQEKKLFSMERDFKVVPDPIEKRKVQPELLSSEEIRNLLELKVDFGFCAYRDKAIFETLYSTGMRLNELREIRCRDVNPVLGYLSFRRSGCMVTIPLDKQFNAALFEYIQSFRENSAASDEPLFPNRNGGKLSRQSIWKIIASFAKKKYPEKLITPYGLRKSFAIQMAARGASYEHISKIFGIKDLSFLLEEGCKDMKNYVDFYKYHPKNEKS